MEARAEYLGRVERPRLTVVRDDGGQARYSPLPHAVMDHEKTQHGHIVTYAVLQRHWWQGGECWAAHATLAVEAKCSVRQLQRYLKELVRWGFITERHRGRGQAKAYAPVDGVSQHDTGVALNTTSMSPSTPNTTPVSEQHDTGVRFNTTPVSDKYRRTEEDTYGSKKLEGGAASAADDRTAEPKARKSGDRRTRCPETFPLEAKHYAYGSGLGLGEDRVRTETAKFLDHHRFRGTLGLDWYAGWQKWMRNAVEFDKRSPQPAPAQRNGTASARMFPGEASKQSSWSDPKYAGKVRHKALGERPDGR